MQPTVRDEAYKAASDFQQDKKNKFFFQIWLEQTSILNFFFIEVEDVSCSTLSQEIT